MKLATPGAIVFLIGLGLVYFAIRGWMAKYSGFGEAVHGE